MTELTALLVDTPLEALLDRTACLVPDVQTFTANGAWAKPAHALWVDFVLVNAGQAGAAGGGATGGGGGGAGGCSKRVLIPAALVPTNLVVSVEGVAGAGASSVVDSSGLGFQILPVYAAPTLPTAGGGGAAPGGLAPAQTTAVSDSGSVGGAGSNVGAGTDGGHGITAYGGTGGGTAPGLGGKGGRGYGAGGGGGRGNVGGGGGGGGGYGNVQLAGDGSNVSYAGGLGAPGVVVITTFRGVAL